MNEGKELVPGIKQESYQLFPDRKRSREIRRRSKSDDDILFE